MDDSTALVILKALEEVLRNQGLEANSTYVHACAAAHIEPHPTSAPIDYMDKDLLDSISREIEKLEEKTSG